MKPNSLFILSFLVLPLLAGAQNNYKKGLVITEQGDTLKGYINDRDWLENPEKISYKETLESNIDKVFDLGNSSFFQIIGEDAYQKYTVSVSMDEINISKLNIGADTSKAIEKVFLKVLVDGCNVNLYSYTDDIKTRYYFWDKSTALPVELSYKLFYYIRRISDPNKPSYLTNDIQKLVIRKNYIGQLNYLATQFGMNSKDLTRKINIAPYRNEELSEIIVQINGNDAINMCMISGSKEKSRLLFFAGIILRRSSLNYMEAKNCFTVNSGSDHKAYWSPAVGIGFDLALNTGSRFYIREELVFSRDKLASSDQYSEPLNGYYEDYQYNLSQWNLTLSNGLNYNIYHASKMKGYIGAGIDVHFSRITTSKYRTHAYDLFNDDIYERTDILPSWQNWITFPVKAGIIINSKFDINYTYRIPLSISGDGGFSKLVNVMEMGIAYFLK
jgi:hypothetical protein